MGSAILGALSAAACRSPASRHDRNVSQLGAVQSVRYGLSSALSTLPVIGLSPRRQGRAPGRCRIIR
jgi:hypothetical protein